MLYYSCNLGDSRIYRSDREKYLSDFTRPRPGAQFVWKGTINTVSWDGRRKSADWNRRSAGRKLEIGDRFLLCSDGITDMLSDGEIADILSRDIPVAKTVEILVDRALKKGGRDNITVVLCEIMEQPRNMFGRVLNWFHRQNEGDI